LTVADAYPESVTLILSLNTPDAVCMSVDYRVSNLHDGKVLDPFAVKSLTIQTSDDPGGPIALIGYAGLAQLWGKMPMGRWLRETLRGECQSLFELMDHLLHQLNLKIASFRQVLVINVLMVAQSGDERYFAAFSNTQDRLTAEPKFTYGVSPLDNKSRVIANGSACEAALTPGYVTMLKDHVAKPNNSPDDHMELLAKINRDVAEVNPDGPVSPYCHVTCVGGGTDWKPTSRIFTQPGEEPPPLHMSSIFCGIDLSYQAEQVYRAMMNQTHPVLDEDQIRRNLKRRP
jgi:hypothetical protein